MKRTTPLKRSGFTRKARAAHEPAADREPKPMAFNVKPIRQGTYAGSTRGPVPKTEPRRNPHLLTLAKGQQCLLRIPGVCVGYSRTVVACHSNLSRHGKGGARKADDHYTVWGCMACHIWLDQGGACAADKEAAFERAHREQRLRWAEIAFDPYGSGLYPPKGRAAARWAFDQCCEDQRRAEKEQQP